MNLKLIQVTDSKSGTKVTVNVENVCYFLDMGQRTLISFSRSDIVVQESYHDIQCMIRNL